MKRKEEFDVLEKNINLISNIFLSFEELEKSLVNLNLNKPLFLTYTAKKEFARTVFDSIKKQEHSIH